MTDQMGLEKKRGKTPAEERVRKRGRNGMVNDHWIQHMDPVVLVDPVEKNGYKAINIHSLFLGGADGRNRCFTLPD